MNALNKDNYSMRLDYPVRFDYNDSIYVPVQPLPQTVSVNVSGEGWKLLRKSWLSRNAAPVEYRVNNPLRATVINSISLTDQIAEHFPDLRVNYVVADTFELGFERKVSRIIPLRVDSLGIDMRDGYVVSSFINVSPSLISVEGPASLVNSYPSTLYIRIPTRRIQNNYDESLRIPIQPHPLVQLSHSDVYVSFEVAQVLRPIPAEAPPL
ncbi:hypothetical protein GCM10027275_44460 [Rhabdobacter roseus]